MADYPLSEFIQNVKGSDGSIFGKVGISHYVQSDDFKDRAGGLSLFPSWIINDDLFSIIPIIYGVTNFAHELKQSDFVSLTHTVRVYVIPQSVVSVYDQSVRLIANIPNIEEYLKRKESDIYLFRRDIIPSASCIATDIGKTIQDLYDDIRTVEELRDENRGDEHMDVVVLFDRRICTKTGNQSVVVFECRDWRSFGELKRNNLIGFDLEINGGDGNDDDNDAVRAYLNYGIQQRLRFYPEFMVSVFAKLFVTPLTMTEYEYLQKLYSAEYKKGWNLNLDDQRFNDHYKAITGTTHETNNYYRDSKGDDSIVQKFGFFPFVQKRFGEAHIECFNQLMAYWKSNLYDSDTVIDDILDQNTKSEKESNIGLFMGNIRRNEWRILKKAVFDWNQMDCTVENVLNVMDCIHFKRLIANLNRFNESNYIINTLNMKQFNLNQIIGDFDHLVSVHDLFDGDRSVRIQQYIANQIVCEQSSACLVLNEFRNREQKKERDSELNGSDVSPAKCAVLKETLCGIHCYLLHRTDELYRNSSNSEASYSKFKSLVNEKKSNDDDKDDTKDHEPLSIDFGVSVIQWLSFGEEPEFDGLRGEMLGNEDSTITVKAYGRMEIQCAEKIITEQFSDYQLDEMMGFKFYSDYTDDCANLRKAHWKSVPKKTKKRYYHWARTIYRAALRHAVPIPLQSGNKNAAKWLYHGLSLLFRMDNESPTYFGPFSTTLTSSVADGTFAKGEGIRLDIKSGYEDSMTRCLAIDFQSISCYGNEGEMLLVDQPIPIKRAKTYKPDHDAAINHFLYSLKTRDTEIRDPNQFYNKLGIKYRKKWIESIGKHDALYAKSKYNRKLVIQRVINELGISEVLIRSKCFSPNFADCIVMEESGSISLDIDPSDNHKFIVWNPSQSQNQELLKVYDFVVQNVTKNIPEKLRITKNYRFSNISDFRISSQDHMTPMPETEIATLDDGVQRIQITVSLPDVFDAPIPIKILQFPMISAGKVQCNEVVPFRIGKRVKIMPFDESKQCGGKLNIISKSSIIIGKEGGINGSNCGLRRGSKYGNRNYLKYGQFIGNTEEQNGSEIDNGAGGGIMVLFASESIVNDGVLLCESSGDGVFSGGAISINTVSDFVNNGIMSCGGDGLITILCRKFVNEGQIEPVPTVQMMERVMVKQCVDAQAVKKEQLRMEMNVVDHRGHDVRWNGHPRHLLEPGKDTKYLSVYGEPEKDWIIFSAETVGHYITSIGIRNDDDDWAIKRISIEGSADNKEYEHWMEIGGIEKGIWNDSKLQLFGVDIASSIYAKCMKWKFYKILIVQNHGSTDGNIFYEFVFFSK